MQLILVFLIKKLMKNKQEFIVSCIQTNSSENEDKNINQVNELLVEAVKLKSEVVFLPECVGIFSDSVELLNKFSKSMKFLQFIIKCAVKYKIFISIGSLPFKTKNKKFLNRSYVINPVGKVLETYDKINLFDVYLSEKENYLESKNYDAGKVIKTCKLPWGKLGLSICYDLRFPSIYKKLSKQGARFLSIPAAFTKTTGKVHWHALVKSRAIENGCFVFAACQCGKHDNGRETFGHSVIIDPWGNTLAEGKDNPEVISAKIDLKLVEIARRKIPSMTKY